jgi:hypothetical protein
VFSVCPSCPTGILTSLRAARKQWPLYVHSFDRLQAKPPYWKDGHDLDLIQIAKGGAEWNEVLGLFSKANRQVRCAGQIQECTAVHVCMW